MSTRRSVAAARLVLVAAALAVAMTWPLAPGLATRGRVDTYDGYFSLWNVAWVAHSLTTSPARLYDANIFYPHRTTLAYSEANIGAGVLAVPAWLATRNPLAAHNSVVLLAFVLSFAGAYFLARYLGAQTLVAMAAGAAFAYCPFIFARFAHIQLLLTAGLPFSLLAMHALLDRPSWTRAVLLGVVIFMQGLSCAYYGVSIGMTVGIGVLYYAVARGEWRSARYWLRVTLAATVAVALILPFFLPYLRIQADTGFTRSLRDASMYSANWQAWLASASWLHRQWLGAIEGFSEVLFPGIVATLGGVWGFISLWRAQPLSKRPATVRPEVRDGARDEARNDEAPNGSRAGVGRPRETAGFYGLVAALAFWASLGPKAGLYTALFYTVPVFSFLRAPARFGILVALALVVLAAVAFARWSASRPPVLARRLALVALVVVVAELFRAPVGLPRVPPMNGAFRLLAQMPRGVLVELPFFWIRSDFPRHAEYMFYSTAHWQPLVNGYSDHIPAEFRSLAPPVNTFPSEHAFALLKGLRVRYVAVHLNYYDRRSREKLEAALERFREYLRPLHQEGDVWLYEIVAWPR
jgi:hypothetical protein